jgi:hypothetical protein
VDLAASLDRSENLAARAGIRQLLLVVNVLSGGFRCR